MPASTTSTTRRTALGGAVVVGWMLSGCSLDELTGRGGTAPSTPTSPDADTPPADADSALVEEVVADLLDAIALIGGVVGGAPALRRELRPLLRAHEAHLRVLDDGATPSSTGGVLRSNGRTQVLQRERRLQRSVAAASLRAESGALAGLLASVSASTAQHVAALGGAA